MTDNANVRALDTRDVNRFKELQEELTALKRRSEQLETFGSMILEDYIKHDKAELSVDKCIIVEFVNLEEGTMSYRIEDTQCPSTSQVPPATG